MYPKTQNLILEQWQEGVYPGVIYCLMDEDKEITHVLGNSISRPQPEKMTKNSLFDVASLTKVVCTTTVILSLLEDGKIQLDSPLQVYLPDFRNGDITLRHLLTHTSDIVSWIEHRDQLDKESLRQAYLQLSPGKNLGKKVKYTDSGMILLGFMIEEIFHRDVTDVFQSKVLMPLQMGHSFFSDVRSTGLAVGTQTGLTRGLTHDPKARILAEHAANAGLFTTIDDLKNFVQMYFGQISLLQRKTILSLLNNYVPASEGQRSLGWELKDHQQVLFHTGYTGTFLAIDPLGKQAFIFLSNRIHPYDHRQSYIKHRDCLLKCYLSEKREY